VGKLGTIRTFSYDEPKSQLDGYFLGSSGDMFVYQSPSAISGASTISMQLTGNTMDIDLSREGNTQHVIIETKDHGFTSG
jgi:hypothetical protein